MKIALIGGNWFLGSALVPWLKACGREIMIVGRRAKPDVMNTSLSYIQNDCRNSILLNEQLQDVEEIIDFSYTTTPKTSFDDPISDLLSNLTRAVSVFEACRVLPNLKKFIVVSSGGTVYGKRDILPIKETVSTNPISPYGITKLTIEKYAHMYQELYNFPMLIARPSNVYGPKDDFDVNQDFINVSMSQIIRSKIIDVFGENGTVRDYLYLDDLAEALLSLLQSGNIGKIYNIGTGIGTNNIELLSAISNIVNEDGYSLHKKISKSRPFDVPRNILDYSLITNDTGWQPKTTLEVGLRKTWNHIKSLNT